MINTILVATSDVNDLNLFIESMEAMIDFPSIVESKLIDEGFVLIKNSRVFTTSNYDIYNKGIMSLDKLIDILEEEEDVTLFCSIDVAETVSHLFKSVFVCGTANEVSRFYTDNRDIHSIDENENGGTMAMLNPIPDSLIPLNRLLKKIMYEKDQDINPDDYKDITFAQTNQYENLFLDSELLVALYMVNGIIGNEVKFLMGMLSLMFKTTAHLVDGFVYIASFLAGCCLMCENGSDVHYQFVSGVLLTLDDRNEAMAMLKEMISKSMKLYLFKKSRS